MRTFKFVLLLTIVGTFAQPSSAQLGDVLRHATRAKKAVDIYTPWTAEQEQAIGQASAAKLINIFGLYENPDMVKYVNFVGNAVARQGSRSIPYRFGILDSEVITAVSLPGGYIFVTRGALANLHNESELAGTLAHEIAHVDRRHLEKEIRAKKTTQFATEEAASRVPAGAELINLAGDIVTKALTLQISRDKETEADKVGMDLAAKTGYDAAGLRNFIQFLAQVPATPETKRQLGLWGSTHPPFSERVAALTALLPAYSSSGQQLQERYAGNINPVNFAKTFSASQPGGPEMDGIVSKGVVVLTGGTLPEGSRVKVRVVQ